MPAAGGQRFIPNILRLTFQQVAVNFAVRYLVAVHRLDEAGAVDRIGSQRFPLPVQLRHVGHHCVSMDLRVEVTRSVVREQRSDHFSGWRDARDAVLRVARAHHLFHDGQRFFHRIVVRLQQAFIAAGEDQH